MHKKSPVPCRFALLAVALMFLPRPCLQAAVQNRIARKIDNAQLSSLPGHLHPRAQAALDQGRVAGATPMERVTLVFKPTAAQQTDLETLLAQQQDRSSPNYHQWLTPEQYADRFGLSPSDVAQVVGWLQAQGFKVVEQARSRTYVAFNGTAAQVEAAFHIQIHQFVVDGEKHIANVTEPSLPTALADVVVGIRGLHDFRPKARTHVRRMAVHPDFTSSVSGNHYLTPGDFAVIYDLNPLYQLGIDGTGQKVAVMGQTDLVLADITNFRSISGLSSALPTVMLASGSPDPGVVSGDIDEASLDVEWAGAVARNASIIYVNSNNAFTSLQYAITNNVAPVISISYGDCEPNFAASEITTLQQWGAQANAQGQTVVGPSGDTGAADCDYPISANQRVTVATRGLQVDVPAALPYVTGVGGTTFNEGTGSYWTSATNADVVVSALSYIPETAWNDTTFEIANGGSLAATGGGASTLFTKPSWQTGPGVPSDGARDVPDVSFPASFDHDGYLICSASPNSVNADFCVNGFRYNNPSNANDPNNQTLDVVGGTSVGVPAFAGVVALINQKVGGTGVGNVNPRLYQMAAASSPAFHDIVTGSNVVPCTVGTKNCTTGNMGYNAGVGYDPVTGLGSLDVYNLVMEFSSSTTNSSPDFVLSVPVNNSSLSVTRGSSTTATIKVAAVNGFTGTVTFTCSVSSNLTGTTCSVPSTGVAPGSSVTVTITSASASRPAPVVALFTGSGSAFLLACGMVLGGFDLRRGKDSRRKKTARLGTLVIVLLLIGLLMLGCGGGGGSSTSSTSSSGSGSTTATGTGSVTVTGTGGGNAHSIQIPLTVN